MACYSRYYIRHYYGDVSFKETQFEKGETQAHGLCRLYAKGE